MTTTIRTNIYVVDDDASVRRSLARVVRSAGHNAVTFASAEDFFASDYRTGEGWCLIVDAKMPRSSGLDMLTRLRGERVPGIALVDKEGAKILAMGGTIEKGYGIIINDKKEVQRIGLGYKEGNAGIMLYNEKGQYVRGLIRQEDGLNYASYIDDNEKEIFE